MIPAFLIRAALAVGVPQRFAKAAVIVAVVTALIVGLGVAKCSYDRSVIRKHEQAAALKQAKRERAADQSLEKQKDNDAAAKAKRQQEMDNATKGIPDQAPSARQRAIACAELRREAQERRKPVPAC